MRIRLRKTTALAAAAMGASLTILFVTWLITQNLKYTLDHGSTAYRYIIIENGFLLLVLVILSLVYADERKRRWSITAIASDQTVRLLKRLDDISNRRTVLSIRALKSENDMYSREERANATGDFLRFLIDEAREIFDDYVGEECAVTIKLLWPVPDGNPEIRTYLRDSRSSFIRAQFGGEVSKFSEHSPFVKIVSDRARDSYYVNNNLQKSHREDLYVNSNPVWRLLYNATLVVPISEPLKSHENILGFLCVDSLRGKFDDAACIHIARTLANSIYLSITELSMLEVGSLKRPENISNRKQKNAV